MTKGPKAGKKTAKSARPTPPATAPAFVWARVEPVSHPVPGPLSTDRIVRAALAIADKDGLESVSFRNIGAALNAGPMRLYRYLSTKADLLELMVDAVYGEMTAAGPTRGDWREVLRSHAHLLRRAAKHHKWFIGLLGGRPHLGPNAFTHLEASLAALSENRGFEEIDTSMEAESTVTAYVIGALQREASELRAELDSGMDERQWRNATWPYLQRMIATGRFPMIARVVQDATHPSSDVVFDRGLDCVIDGIAARLVR